MPFEDLREFLRFLEEKGELARVEKEVDLRYEIGAYIRKTSDIQGPALYFEKVRGRSIPAVGGIFSSGMPINSAAHGDHCSPRISKK